MSYRGNSTITFPLAASIAFHALFLFLYVYFVLMRPESRNVVLNNVDLILQEKEARAHPERNKTLNFLKMALPQLPKPVVVAEVPKPPPLPAPMDIKPLETARKALDLPQKLAERDGRLQNIAKLELDAGRKLSAGPKDAALDIRAERGAQALAPRIELEEVGMKKAPAIPQGLKYEDSGGPVVRPQTMQELDLAVASVRRAVAGPQGLAERQGTVAAVRETPAVTAAPQRLTEARDAGVQLAARPQPVMTAETISLRRNSEVLRQAKEEAPRLEITGPLSKRKVLAFYAPAYPDWARDRGVLEAAVAIKFYVDNSGAVLDNAVVDKTSGYGALDRLALAAIKRWSFEAIGGPPSTQWGVITFRFVAD